MYEGRIIDDRTVNGLLMRAARIYGCKKSNPECEGGCVMSIEKAKFVAAMESEDKDSAVIFASGITFALGFLLSVDYGEGEGEEPTDTDDDEDECDADYVTEVSGSFLSLVAVEALRFAGRVTDSDIEKACDEYETKRSPMIPTSILWTSAISHLAIDQTF
jgi:hypothetical protein